MTWNPDGRFYDADPTYAPARDMFKVTPNNSQEISPLPKAILFGAEGVATVRAIDSDSDVQIPVYAGFILPVRIKWVRSTGTTADLPVFALV